jgi:hypothetical protein
LIERFVWVEFCDPKPWILSTVRNENICASSMMESKLCNGSLDLKINSKDGFTIILPVFIAKKCLRSHWMLLRWHLIKSEFSAVLVSPWSSSACCYGGV